MVNVIVVQTWYQYLGLCFEPHNNILLFLLFLISESSLAEYDIGVDNYVQFVCLTQSMSYIVI